MATATYLDSSVLIAGFRAVEPDRSLARSIIFDPRREIFYSEFSVLETLPLPAKNRRLAEIAYLEDFFASTAKPISIPLDVRFYSRALQIACKYGLSGMDALHLASCIEGGVAEFVTMEGQRRAFGGVVESGLTIIFLGKKPLPKPTP
jgi:predicted nucleic acid-binding protein